MAALLFYSCRREAEVLRRTQIQRSTKPMRRTPMKRGTKCVNPIGPKGQQWIDVRKDIKQRFEWAGITTCEFRYDGCWFNDGLGFAHCRKRRKIQGDEIYHCALACNHCHDKLDLHMTHKEMHDEVHRIIDRRGLIAPPAILQQVQEQANGNRRTEI